MKHRKTSWLTVRVEFVNSPGFSLTPSSPQRFDAKWQTQPAFYPSPAGGTLSPDISSCPASCLRHLSTSWRLLHRFQQQPSLQSLTSSDPPHICCEWASGAVLSVSGTLTECFFFCLTSTYLLTFAWKASIGLWRSIVLVFSSERSSARSAGCVCASYC